MLQREHAAARRFVKRQAAAIDALTEVLFEKKSVDDSEISVRISQSPRSACLIAHTRPAKGLLRPEGRIPSDCYPDCLRNTNPSYTWSERLTLSFLRARKKSSGANGKSEPRRRKTAKGLFCPRFLKKIIPWEPGSCARMSWRVGRSRGGRRERRRGGVISRVGWCAVINQKIHRKLQPFFLRVFQRITVGFFHLLLHPHAAHPRARASLCRVVRHGRGVVPGYSLAVVVVRV